MPNPSAKTNILSIPAKTLKKQKLGFSHSAQFHMENRVSLKYCVTGCRWKNLNVVKMFFKIRNLQIYKFHELTTDINGKCYLPYAVFEVFKCFKFL